jgi:hypothetical protein
MFRRHLDWRIVSRAQSVESRAISNQQFEKTHSTFTVSKPKDKYPNGREFNIHLDFDKLAIPNLNIKIQHPQIIKPQPRTKDPRL